jgi:hypothetical protein
MTWDEPSSFFFGRTPLHFYLSGGDRTYVTDARYKDASLFGQDPFQYIYGEDVYPPFPFIVASKMSMLLAEKVPLMSSEVAHHLAFVLIGSLGVLAMYGIGRLLGWTKWLATGIALLYGTYPTIVAQMRNDAKDVPLMSMLVICVYFVLRMLKSVKSNRRIFFQSSILASITFGLSVASKPTAIIIIPILGVWFILAFALFPKFRQEIGRLRLVLASLFVMIPLSVLAFFLTWPWLWDDPVGKLTQVWSFFKVVGRFMPTLYLGTVYTAGKDLPWHYPLGILSLQTPVSVLFVGACSLIFVLIYMVRKRDGWSLLFLLWIAIGMGRFFVPGVLIYAKVRHFIDAMPAFFVIIGIFLHTISTGKRSRIKSGMTDKEDRSGMISTLGFILSGKIALLVSQIVLCIMLLEQGWIITTHFPYEPSYFNAFIGGTKKVAEKKLFDIEYWASGVKDAMKYIDSQTKSGEKSKVYACTMAHLALFYETPSVVVTGNPIGATYTLVPNSASWFGGVAAYMKENHELVYTISRAGGDLFYVYKHKSFSGWNCGQETSMVYERP